MCPSSTGLAAGCAAACAGCVNALDNYLASCAGNFTALNYDVLMAFVDRLNPLTNDCADWATLAARPYAAAFCGAAFDHIVQYTQSAASKTVVLDGGGNMVTPYSCLLANATFCPASCQADLDLLAGACHAEDVVPWVSNGLPGPISAGGAPYGVVVSPLAAFQLLANGTASVPVNLRAGVASDTPQPLTLSACGNNTGVYALYSPPPPSPPPPLPPGPPPSPSSPPQPPPSPLPPSPPPSPAPLSPPTQPPSMPPSPTPPDPPLSPSPPPSRPPPSPVPSPVPPAPLPPAPSESTFVPVGVPTVFTSLCVFGPTLDGEVSDAAAAAVAVAIATAAGTDVSLVSMARAVEYVLSFVVAVPGASTNSVSGPTICAALLNATTADGMSLQVVGINSGSSRRRLLVLEATVLGFSANRSHVVSFNSSLAGAFNSGALTASLRAVGINTTGASLPVPPQSGLQFGVSILCPSGNVDAALQAVSPGALDASPTLLADLNNAGIGSITGARVTLAPIVGEQFGSGPPLSV